MSAKYEIFRSGHNSQYYFRLKAGNGEIILQSEGYQSKAGAQNGVGSVRQNSPYDHLYDRKTSSNGNPYFVLNATNGQIIGASQMYSSTSARDAGISSVKTNGPTAPTVDLT
ncbi:YegP family protein [Vreelandella boliviensis]|uniref:YegP family protein n=1 Tax=Vreelandella boliviensis TaxID=223527 RepID=UPI001B8CDCB5|nr:YegP family protein [Halomonas boliviensis]MBS3670009.1 YegP family protein [Halomonas boliviensis]